MSAKHKWDDDDELKCRPLDSFYEIHEFLSKPPPWWSLCTELVPHSEYAVRNMDNQEPGSISLETPATFCHINPDTEEMERHKAKSLPKTLVCHDMANGYHDDSVVDGTGAFDAYSFYNWGGIDVFCYFSHHFVTVPPLGWINVGHAHGVQVIGTVITEWTEGVVIWERLLASEAEWRNFANNLVAIARTLKFDGWLLNIENKISKPDVLLEFVGYLHAQLHQELRHPLLIWYDSVTVDGKLHWQNGLNGRNKAFFDACDGIFTNYTWSEAHVQFSVQEAGARRTDVYIGIDVWGRNFLGGGQFNTQAAIKIAHKHGCSLAIFAPAWSHEAIPDDDPDVKVITMSKHLDRFKQFKLRERAVWGSFWPFLNTKLPRALPFQTSFCRGQGKKRRLYGDVVSPAPWFNLRHMQYQPNSMHGPHGYLLTTIHKLLQVPSESLAKDKAGIIKYRQSFINTQFLRMQDEDDSSNEEETDVEKDKDTKQAKLNLEEGYQNINKDEGPSKQEGEIVKKNHETLEEDNPIELKPYVDSRTALQTFDGENRAGKPKNVFKYLFRLMAQNKQKARRASFNADEKEAGPSATKRVALSDEVEVKKALQTIEEPEIKPEIEPEEEYHLSAMRISMKLELRKKGEEVRFALAFVPGEKECLEVYEADSFNGGTCLRINPNDVINLEQRTIRLFHCDFFIKASVIACVVTKHMFDYEEQFLNVTLRMTDADGKSSKTVLMGSCSVPTTEANPGDIYPLNHTDRFKDVQKYMLLNEPGFYVPVENSFGWMVRYYLVHRPGARITSITCTTEPCGPILLGHFGLCLYKELGRNIV